MSNRARQIRLRLNGGHVGSSRYAESTADDLDVTTVPTPHTNKKAEHNF